MRLLGLTVLQAITYRNLSPTLLLNMSVLRVRLTMQRCWRRFNQTYQGIQITLAYNISVSSRVSQRATATLMQRLTHILFSCSRYCKRYILLAVFSDY